MPTEAAHPGRQNSSRPRPCPLRDKRWRVRNTQNPSKQMLLPYLIWFHPPIPVQKHEFPSPSRRTTSTREQIQHTPRKEPTFPGLAESTVHRALPSVTPSLLFKLASGTPSDFVLYTQRTHLCSARFEASFSIPSSFPTWLLVFDEDQHVLFLFDFFFFCNQLSLWKQNGWQLRRRNLPSVITHRFVLPVIILW